MKAKIIVRLKSIVHDPQGEAIWQSLQHMGYTNVTSVRQGKIFDFELPELSEPEAKNVLDDLARRVLANPIIEEYAIEIGEKFMKVKVVVFPGSNCDHDTEHAFRNLLRQDVDMIWHKEERLGNCDLVILPGGFSYGDYLRTGAMARFSPIMKSVEKFAREGGHVFGICNGFQILCEAGLLPGALMKNACLQFRCLHVNLRVETTRSPLSKDLTQGQILRIPIAHGDGNYYADHHTLNELIDEDRILFRYCTPDGLILPEANPNGSMYSIAGICNQERNVYGMMPHPERAAEISTGSADGMLMLQSLIQSLENASVSSERISVA